MTWQDRLIALSERRPPDLEIGPKDDPYLRRWWLIPRNPVFNIYLHNIRHSDDDRALHDHPSANVSIILRGGYIEVTPIKGAKRAQSGRWAVQRIRRWPGDVVWRLIPWRPHRLEMPDGVTDAWTLFITGPRIRTWGFHRPHGWVPWTEFTASGAPGQVGKGCD